MTPVTIRHFCPSEGVIVVLSSPLVVECHADAVLTAKDWHDVSLSALKDAWRLGDMTWQMFALYLSALHTYDLAGLRIHAPSEEAAIAAALEERWADLDDRVDAWHAGKGDGQTLPEFLGMTEAEYAEWAADPSTLPVPDGWVCLPVET